MVGEVWTGRRDSAKPGAVACGVRRQPAACGFVGGGRVRLHCDETRGTSTLARRTRAASAGLGVRSLEGEPCWEGARVGRGRRGEQGLARVGARRRVAAGARGSAG
jgi:hypothetical protein